MRQLTDNARETWPASAARRAGPWLLAFLLWATGGEGLAAVSVAPAPAGEELSRDYTVAVEGQPVPVYAVKVAPADPARRWKAMDDKAHSADFFDTAAFASFDMDGPVKVTVTCAEPITAAKVLPTSFGIVPAIQGKSLTLKLDKPRLLTIEVNGNWVHALHLFANPPEVAVPRPDDPNVIYFGPGVHHIKNLTVGDNKTVYLAPGAVVKGTKEGPGTVFWLEGKNIVLRGRGILDGGLCPTHSRHLLLIRGQDITVEGIILRDSSVWTIPIRKSDRVTVRNVKLLGYRANSDGIDICNSRDVRIEGCFIRTLDDLIVIKTDQGQGEARRIVAKDCVLWNEVAHALSVGAELREKVDDVLFTNCDVIHDKGREWTLRVFHCDSARVSNIRFENLRIEESPRLISVWIGKYVWTRDTQRGQIQDVTFKNIRATAEHLRVELTGFDEAHRVQDVLFQDVVVNGKPLVESDVKENAFVRNIRVRP
jgi:hypothetical protein